MNQSVFLHDLQDIVQELHTETTTRVHNNVATIVSILTNSFKVILHLYIQSIGILLQFSIYVITVMCIFQNSEYY